MGHMVNSFNLEVDKLRQMFKLNGYPLYYFNKVLDKFLNSSNNDNEYLDSNDDVEFVVIKIPFIGDHSYSLSNKLKKLIEDANNCKVRIVFTSFKLRNYFSLKAKTPKHLLSNVVYKFTCQNDSELTYIGETKRHLSTRAKEHLSLSNPYQNSEVKSHVKNCSQCISSASFNSFQVIKKYSDSFTT